MASDSESVNWSSLPTGSPAVFILGEAGIGKSAALRAAAKRHEGGVFSVSCQRIAQDIAFDPLVALLQIIPRRTGLGRHRSASEKDVILELQFALERSTMNQEPLVQIDDLHWADRGTLDAIPYLVERLQDTGVQWHFASRSGYDRIGAAFHRLRQTGLASDLTLRPLSDRAIAAIVDEHAENLERQQRAVIVAQSGGNPLYAQLLARASSPAAPNMSGAALDHVVDLPADALTVAVALAIVEDALTVSALEEVTALSPRTVSEALSLLRGRRLVETRQNRFAVRHHLLADAILSVAPSEVTTRVHLAAAHLADGDERRGRHLLAAGLYGEARSRFARDGWNALEAEDWEVAARCFAEALALEEPRDAPPTERAESISAAFRLTRRITDGDAFGAISPDDVRAWSGLSELVRARLELARIVGLLFLSTGSDVTGMPLAALAGGEIEPGIASELYYECVRAARHHLDDDAAKTFLEKMHALIPSLTSMPSRTKALARGAMYVAIYEDWDRGIAEFEDAIRAGAAAHAYDAVLQLVNQVMGARRGLSDRKEVFLALGRFANELSGGSLRYKTAVAANYSAALREAGRPKEAMSVLTAAAAAVPSLPRLERESFRAYQIVLASELGLVDSARSLVAECGDFHGASAQAQLAIGQFNEEHGDLEVARAALEVDFESPLRALPHNLAYALVTLARIALRTSDVPLMQRTIRRLRKLRDEDPLTTGFRAWGESYELLMAGKKDAALALLRRAKEAPFVIFERARIQLEIAMITTRREDFVEAVEQFRAIDCDYMIDRIADITKRIVVKIGKELRTSEPSLTNRQRTIALMLSAGKTNAEIASALSISKRTVDHHVDHIRDKLGVRSRVEIAVAVANGAAFH